MQGAQKHDKGLISSLVESNIYIYIWNGAFMSQICGHTNEELIHQRQ